MMPSARILVVDDEPAARAVVAAALTGLDLEIVACASAAEAQAQLHAPFDAIILDLMMPEVDGMELCRRLRRDPATRDVPILMLTAFSGREEKLACLDAGADDFLSKPVDRLELKTRIAAICRFNRHRRSLESRHRLDALVASSPSGVVVVDAELGRVRFANDQAVQLLGVVSPGAFAEAFDDRAQVVFRCMLEQARTGVPITQDDAPWPIAAGPRECLVRAAPVSWEGAPALQLVLTDITPLRRFEREVHRLERLDVSARLAASVVHDLATVLQLCGVHLRTLSGPADIDTAQLALDEMRRALRRGGQLTRDLMAFSRRGRVAPGGSCDAAVVVHDLVRLLPSMLPSTIHLEVDASDAPRPVGVADYQLEQVLVNLATNARDAMPGGGTLRLSLAESEDGSVLITVRDTGTGVDPLVLERLGEPFLSTKPEGQGAGLGLWSVRRVLEGAGGDWRIESSERGTAVHLSLPSARNVAAMA